MTNPYTLDDYSTLDLKLSGGDTIPIAGIQEVSVVPSVSIERLMTADSIKTASKLQHEFMVDVSIGYSLWDPDVVRQWLDDSTAADGTDDPVTMADDSSPTEYEIDVSFVSKADNDTVNATVEGITFEEMPIFDAGKGEFAQWDLDGTGDDLTGFEVV